MRAMNRQSRVQTLLHSLLLHHHHHLQRKHAFTTWYYSSIFTTMATKGLSRLESVVQDVTHRFTTATTTTSGGGGSRRRWEGVFATVKHCVRHLKGYQGE